MTKNTNNHYSLMPQTAETASSNLTESNVTSDPWVQLKKFTRARIALGRVGSSLPTCEVLDFGLAHAMARDAVHLALDVGALETAIQAQGFSTIRVHSRAPDRANYLLRPDWGRRLDDNSLIDLKNNSGLNGGLKKTKSRPIDLLIVVADGLSSLAISRHVLPMLAEIRQLLPTDWQLGPVVIASQARVAIGDEIGQALNARMVAMLIGERPGLSSPDSLGIYLTYQPTLGLSDADRNCISNVRPEGLQYTAAAKKLMWLAGQAMRLKLSGVALKDESDVQEIAQPSTAEIE
jgi:ethanolamine ammonia-lyase small subunit